MIKLGRYIASKKFDDYELGVSDCNTFTAGWIDELLDTDIESEITGKYNNVRSMLRFAKVKKIRKELEKAGYSRVFEQPTTGDILIRRDPAGFYVSCIVLGDAAVTMHEDLGLAQFKLVDIDLESFEVWRLTHGR
jgi:hypothetical protein